MSLPFHSFRDKYFALPGDLRNAVQIWGGATSATADGMDATCAALLTASTDSKTCNGDGNGRISDYSYPNNGYEVYRAWQQLANAGMINGDYSGVRGSSAFLPIPGINAPRSPLGTGLWRLRHVGDRSDTYYWNASYAHVLEFFSSDSSLVIVRPEETWNIDTKLDDGLPGSGRIMVWRQSYAPLANCTSTDTQASAVYKLDFSDLACIVAFKLGF